MSHSPDRRPLLGRITRLLVTAIAFALLATLPATTIALEQPPAGVTATPPSPTDIDAWLRKGMEQNAAGRYQEALDAFQQAVAIDPTNSFAWFNLGTSAALLGRYREAAGFLREAVKITPDLLPAWSNLGALYNHLQSPAEALAAFQEVVRLQPGNAEAHYQSALALLALGRMDEARAEYLTLRSIDPALAEKLRPSFPEQKK